MPKLRPLTTVYSPPPAEKSWRLEDLYPGAIRYHSFGRRALASALELIGAEGKTVLVPEFVCRDLLSSLHAAGAKAAYYPVGEDLAPSTAPERWPEAHAVLAVDYFGFPQELAPFREYCRRRGALLIEDNAHGLFSRDEEGALLGARGDLGILSLRKSLPLPNGAALVSPEPGRFSLAPQEPFDAPDEPRYLAKQALRVVARNLGPRVSLRGLNVLRSVRHALRGYRYSRGNPQAETSLPLPERPCGQLAQPLRAAEPAAEVERRRALYELVEQRLKPTGVRPVFETLPKGVCPYGFPYRARLDQLAPALRALAALGLEPLPWPDLPVALAANAPERYRNVMLAHFLG